MCAQAWVLHLHGGKEVGGAEEVNKPDWDWHVKWPKGKGTLRGGRERKGGTFWVRGVHTEYE